MGYSRNLRIEIIGEAKDSAALIEELSNIFTIQLKEVQQE